MGLKSESVIPSELKDSTLDITKESVYNETEQIRVASQFSAHLIYTGQVTGKRYEWPKAGDIVKVDAQDVPELLSKVLGEGVCCGGVSQGNVLFCLA